MNRLVLALPLIAVLACAPQPQAEVPADELVEAPAADPDFPGPTGDDACGASGYQSLVGKNIAAVTMPADLNARLLKPGQMVTMEYIASRMTIRLDDDGTILSVRCG